MSKMAEKYALSGKTLQLITYRSLEPEPSLSLVLCGMRTNTVHGILIVFSRKDAGRPRDSAQARAVSHSAFTVPLICA